MNEQETVLEPESLWSGLFMELSWAFGAHPELAAYYYNLSMPIVGSSLPLQIWCHASNREDQREAFTALASVLGITGEPALGNVVKSEDRSWYRTWELRGEVAGIAVQLYCTFAARLVCSTCDGHALITCGDVCICEWQGDDCPECGATPEPEPDGLELEVAE